MDAQGPEVARRFTRGAGVTFTLGIDRAQGLWELYGFEVVPNGFLVDERGIVRYAKIGGFDARNPEDLAAIEALIGPATGSARRDRKRNFRTLQGALRQAEEEWKCNPDSLEKLLNLAEQRVEMGQYEQAREDFEAALEQRKSARGLMGLASVYLDLGDRKKAAEALRQAWILAPHNWIIRKQIWAVEHPEEFYPAINTDWQKQQIESERAGTRR